MTYAEVCRLDQVDPDGGVAVLVGGEAVALVRTHDDRVFALSNYDPFARASVLARGIVGTRTVGGEDVPVLASPLLKQVFDLRTGACLDDPSVAVPTYETRVEDGVVSIGPRRETIEP